MINSRLSLAPSDGAASSPNDFHVSPMCGPGVTASRNTKPRCARRHDPGGYARRLYSEEFSQLAVDILQQHGVRTLLCETFTPTPAISFEIIRRKTRAASVNFTASPQSRAISLPEILLGRRRPALPDFTKDSKTRAAPLAAKGCFLPFHTVRRTLPSAKKVNLRETICSACEELVDFADPAQVPRRPWSSTRSTSVRRGISRPPLADNGVTVKPCARSAIASSTGRPDVSEEISRRLRRP